MRQRVAPVNTIFSVRTHNKQSLNIKLPQLCGTNKGDKMKCEDCKSENLHWLSWVDKDNKYVGESGASENGEYWCQDCQEHKDRGVI